MIKEVYTILNATNLRNHGETMFTSENHNIPLKDRPTLTVKEAAAYTGIGMNKIRDICSDENCQFVLWNGNRMMVKRKPFEDYLNRAYSI